MRALMSQRCLPSIRPHFSSYFLLRRKVHEQISVSASRLNLATYFPASARHSEAASSNEARSLTAIPTVTTSDSPGARSPVFAKALSSTFGLSRTGDPGAETKAPPYIFIVRCIEAGHVSVPESCPLCVSALHADEDALIAEMKPWYDGYCFSRRALKTDPKMYNTDMVSYYLRHYINRGEAPRDMLDRNTATDYNKLDKLIRLDKLDGDRKSVLLEVAQNGFTLGEVQPSFPAHRLIEPDMFKSLLYYYGLLTISGTRGVNTILSIPNNNVRRQFYEYLVIEYNKILQVNMSKLSETFDSAALDGDWRPMMEYICRQYHDTTSVRSLIEGERNIQGFMTAYFSLDPYYLTNPEVELSHGYCDFFLMPDFHRCATTAHAYIVELKYLKPDATEEAAAKQWDEAVEQIRGYGEGKAVRALAGKAALHLIVVQIKGHSLYRMDEIR